MRASVTIAIPTRNRLAYLQAAIESALAAAGSADQIVVSDNASTDDTLAYLARLTDPRLTVVQQATDLGMVGNWNACLAAARGERFILLSDDDLIEPDALSTLGRRLDDPGVAFAYGRTRVIDETGAARTLGHLGPDRETGEHFLRAWFRYERTVYPCAALFRTTELRALGGYEASFGPFADVGAWLGVWAMASDRGIAFTPDIVASYRTHDAALSSGNLETGIKGIRAIASRFSAECGAGAQTGFRAMAAHYVASALRRQARSSSVPLLAYAGLLVEHLPLVAQNWTSDAYWRQAMILADPEAYERDKKRRAAKSAGGV